MIKGQIKSCGSCINFIKWKADKYGGGLCEFLDARTRTGHKGNCKYWKAIPYKYRVKYKNKGVNINDRY
jgi:hypothetical protein